MADENLSPDPAPENAPADPPRRKVYESTLIPRRKRRRFSPWIAVPLGAMILGGLVYVARSAQTPRRVLATAGQIVYASDQGSPGVSHLWTIGGDGTGAKQITNTPVSDTSPVYSPDGSAIAFISTRVSGQAQVYQIDADGAGLVPLTRNAGAKTQPAFAPEDRSLLGYTAGGALSVLQIAENGGSDADRILPPAEEHHTESDDQSSQNASVTIPAFAWAASGAAGKPGLAAVEEVQGLQALAVMPTWDGDPVDHAGGDAQRPRPLLAADTLSVAWSPDGALLAVAALNVKGAPQPFSGIVFFDRQGNAVQRRPLAAVPNASLGPQNPVFTPDGRSLVFELWQQPDLASRKRLGIFTAPADGSAQAVPLYQGDASAPQVSRDGKWVYFLAQRPDGGHDLCRVGLDGGPSSFQRFTSGGDVSGFAVSPQRAKGG